MRCPLPIDWLEYLEGTHSEKLSSHLPTCVSCQLLVEQLKTEQRPEFNAVFLSQPTNWQKWAKDNSSVPTKGDIWLTQDVLSTEHLRNVVLLVLSDVWQEKGDSWCEVAPLTTDIERASSLELVLQRNDTTLEVPMLVLFRLQTTVNTRDFGKRIGGLTEDGSAIVEAALDGHAPEHRFGPRVQDACDERLRAPEDLSKFVRVLGRPYALRVESEDTQPRLPLVISLELHRVPVEQALAERLRLAADTGTIKREYQWIAVIPDRLSFKGRIEYAHSQDELFFVVDDVSGIHFAPNCWALITLSSHRLPRQVTSERFTPAAGSRVRLARNLALMPGEIDHLEVKISDER
ncbi:MAG: hypothetical protein ACR2IF_08905 [Terriglobales bacterium]